MKSLLLVWHTKESKPDRSVGIVNAEALESRPVQNAVQALQGMVPGLQISTTSGTLDKKMDMSIRGTGTIGEGSEGGPLVLIDRHGGRYQLHKPARHREYFCFERRGSLFHLRFTCTVRGYSGNNQKRKER